MIEIYGKYAKAIVYTVENEEYALEDYARAQIQMICNHLSAEGSTIRVMPDVHPGKVGPVGLTMTVRDSILPSLVGVDIGCGMTIAKIKTKGLEFQKLDTVIREEVPVGPKIRSNAHKFADRIDLGTLKCHKSINAAKAIRSIGTLGGGNHFIELDKDDEGNIYLVIHSGSRHLGMEVADYYLRTGQKEAQMKKQGFASYEMTSISGGLMEDYLFTYRNERVFRARYDERRAFDLSEPIRHIKVSRTIRKSHEACQNLLIREILDQGCLSVTHPLFTFFKESR